MIHEQPIQMQITDLDRVIEITHQRGFRCAFPQQGEHMHLISEAGDRVIVDFDSGARLSGDGAVALAGHLLRAGAAQ